MRDAVAAKPKATSPGRKRDPCGARGLFLCGRRRTGPRVTVGTACAPACSALSAASSTLRAPSPSFVIGFM
eukprot:5049318-Prymnesium_polylepis.1